MSWLTRRVLNGATAVFPSSAFARDLLRRDWGVPDAKMHLLHPGVDCSYFVPAARTDEARARFGWVGRTVVLTAGRLQRRKGHDVFIEVVARLKERFPNLLYAIVGSGEERERLDALVKRHNVSAHVQFAGALDDAGLLAAYQQCDLLALPNRAVGNDVEGFGMVLLEAQACGRPVLAGASGGTAETLTPGETGVLVPCDGPDEPAAALAALLSDPARLERMGTAARARMEVTFDWPARAAEAARVFARVSGPLPA